jgi:hypothetical protein
VGNSFYLETESCLAGVKILQENQQVRAIIRSGADPDWESSGQAGLPAMAGRPLRIRPAKAVSEQLPNSESRSLKSGTARPEGGLARRSVLCVGGADGTRTRDLLRDRQAF